MARECSAARDGEPAPTVTIFSIAVTWPTLSPSIFPAADISFAPLAFAAAAAPSFIFTKNGLVSVLEPDNRLGGVSRGAESGEDR